MTPPSPLCVLSNSDSQLLQNSRPFLLVLLPRHPEVVLVLHNVGQHGAAQKHHVLTSRGVFYPDLEFLQKGQRVNREHFQDMEQSENQRARTQQSDGASTNQEEALR